MTAYNREKYIAEAIESVIASTFKNFELIIVDDCSSDRTVEIAKGYVARDSRVSVHVNEKKLGDYPNRNRVASLARGEFIKYLDSDDTIYPYGLQMMVDCMRAFPDAGLGLSQPASGRMRYPVCLSPHEAYERHFLGGGLFNNGPLSAIIRRECFEEVGRFSGKRFVGDFELWLNLARYRGVVLMPMGLTWWRSHGEQEMTHEVSSRAAIGPRVKLIRAALDHSDCPLTRDQVHAALRAARTGHAQQVLSIMRRGHLREAVGLIKASRLEFLDLCRGLVASALKR